MWWCRLPGLNEVFWSCNESVGVDFVWASFICILRPSACCITKLPSPHPSVDLTQGPPITIGNGKPSEWSQGFCNEVASPKVKVHFWNNPQGLGPLCKPKGAPVWWSRHPFGPF